MRRLRNFKTQIILMGLDVLKLKNLGIEKDKFGKIFTFVDFGNMNYWFEKDEYNGNRQILEDGKKLVVDIEKLSCFIQLFSNHKRFYFGLDPQNKKSIRIISKARRYFDKAVTKPI